MKAKRSANDSHRHKREPSLRSRRKTYLKNIIERSAFNSFGRMLKFAVIKSRPRKGEYYYKLKIYGLEALAGMSKFAKSLNRITDNYNIQFHGYVNPRTFKQEIILSVTLYNIKYEEPNEQKTLSDSGRCVPKCRSRPPREEEAGSNFTYLASRR